MRVLGIRFSDTPCLLPMRIRNFGRFLFTIGRNGSMAFPQGLDLRPSQPLVRGPSIAPWIFAAISLRTPKKTGVPRNLRHVGLLGVANTRRHDIGARCGTWMMSVASVLSPFRLRRWPSVVPNRRCPGSPATWTDLFPRLQASTGFPPHDKTAHLRTPGAKRRLAMRR